MYKWEKNVAKCFKEQNIYIYIFIVFFFLYYKKEYSFCSADFEMIKENI